MALSNKRGLKPSASFRQVTASTVRPRIVMLLSGQPGHGKTHFALGAPGPISYMSHDDGHEGVIEKFLKKDRKTGRVKEIQLAEYKVKDAIVRRGHDMDFDATSAQAKELWWRFERDFEESLSWARTTIVDTFDQSWELVRLAAFGRLEEIPPMLYRKINPQFLRLVALAKDSDCNVIFLNRLKKEYATTINHKGKEVSNPTGRMIPAGKAEVVYDVHMDGTMVWTPDDGFHMIVGSKCRQNSELRGETIPERFCNFADVAAMVFGNDPDDWRE